MSSDRLSSPDTADDGLDRVELSDLDASPPQLPIEQDLMQLARLGELRAIQKLFDSGRYTAKSTDEQGITALHVSHKHTSHTTHSHIHTVLISSSVGGNQRTRCALSFPNPIRSRCQRQGW